MNAEPEYVVMLKIGGTRRFMFSRRVSVVNVSLAAKYCSRASAVSAYSKSDFCKQGIKADFCLYDRSTQSLAEKESAAR